MESFPPEASYLIYGSKERQYVFSCPLYDLDNDGSYNV